MQAPAGTTCLACGYDLRGQPLDGACPECSGAVADGLPDSPARRQVVERGLHALIVAAWLSPLCVLGCFVAIFLRGTGLSLLILLTFAATAYLGAVGPARVMRLGGVAIPTPRQRRLHDIYGACAVIGLLLIAAAAVGADLGAFELQTAWWGSGAGFLLLLVAVPRLYVVERMLDRLGFAVGLKQIDRAGSLALLRPLAEGALLTCVCLMHLPIAFGSAAKGLQDVGVCLSVPCLGLYLIDWLLTLSRLRTLRLAARGRLIGVRLESQVHPANEASTEP